MDKEEAERLKRAIEQTRVPWLRVSEIVFNATGESYELTCTYREQASSSFHDDEIWRPRLIRSPRDWIRLLTRHRNLPW